MDGFVIFLFAVIPVAAVIYAIVSIVSYSSAKKANLKNPDTFNAEEMKSRKNSMIISSVVAGVLLAVVIAFACLMFMAVAYM